RRASFAGRTRWRSGNGPPGVPASPARLRAGSGAVESGPSGPPAARGPLPDTAVALFEAARIPGHVEMEQVPTMSLEVQALAGSVGGDQDTDGVLLRVGREGPLDLLPLGLRRRAVVDGDARAGPVGGIDGSRELLLEVTLGVVVLSEDEDPVFVPPGRRALGLCRSEGRQVGAQVLSNPVDQLADPGIGKTPGGLGNFGHLVEELLLTCEGV